MIKIVATVILLCCSGQLIDRINCQFINPSAIKGGSTGSCASLEERQATIDSLRKNIQNSLLTATVIECGVGMWYPVASLDMTDPQQQCPTDWREYNESSPTVRACGRPITNPPSCASVSYTTSRQHSKVCGRVIGYQLGDVHGVFTNRSIGQSYVDGVSITYNKNPRQHIWTYIAALTENGTVSRRRNCPCFDSLGRQTPDFVNNSYYCESANPSDVLSNPGFLYTNDKLWDGQQCKNEGGCCNESLPWFSVMLPNSVSDNIEVRICGNDRSDNSDTLVEQLDIYIQ